MGFRKTYRSSYFAPVVSDGFGESKFVTSSNEDGVDVQSRVFETPDVISSYSQIGRASCRERVWH